MIPVGIHDNLFLSKGTKNDRGTLVLGFKKANDPNAMIADLDSSTDNSASEQRDTDFLIYPIQATSRQGGELDTAQNNSKKVKEVKDQLNHILLNYLPSDQIKWDTTRGTGINLDNQNEKFREQGTLDLIYKNIADQFLAMIGPFIGRESLTFRMVFIRQSSVKHYPALRKRFLTSDPFMEPMSVPKAQSRIHFTKWEIENGFSNPAPISTETADAVGSGEASEADSVFGRGN